MGRGRIIHDLLKGVPIPFPNHAKAQNAATGSVYTSYEVSWVFFWETNV